jgi:hypothetical protein
MRKLASLVFVGSLAVTGCMRNNSPDLDSAEASIDSSNSVESEGNVMMSVTDGADMAGLAALTSDAVALRIAANVALRWSPAGCATVTTSGSNITIKYNDCTGPRGLLHVTGELDLAVSISADLMIHVHGTATNFQVNEATLDIDANATYAVSGTTHTLTVATTGSGTGAMGNQIDHTGNYTVEWDTLSLCGSIDGTWQTTIGGATRSNQVSVSRCAGGCPTGTLTHTGLRGVTLDVTFDGTATASWTTSTGRSGTFSLTCH